MPEAEPENITDYLRRSESETARGSSAVIVKLTLPLADDDADS